LTLHGRHAPVRPDRGEVNLRCLGPRDFGGVKPKQLLEALLIQRGRPLTKDQLAEMIWGDSPPRRVRRADRDAELHHSPHPGHRTTSVPCCVRQ
jgi:hypothetical protein